MKKIAITILFFTLGFFAFAQFPNQLNAYNKNTQVNFLGAIGNDSGLVFRYNFPDTTTANLGWLKGVPNLIIVVNDTLWKRSNSAQYWSRIGSGTGGGGGGKTLTIQSPLTGGSYDGSSPVTIGITSGNFTDAGTDGIVVTGGAGSVIGSGTSISQHVADVSHNGYLSSGDWSTFNSKQSALTIGNLTDVGTDGITVTGGTGSVIGSGTSISQHVADVSHNGYLSSGDWSTFNSKQSALTIGNLTDVGTDGITVTGGTGSVIGSGTSVAQHVADVSHNGYLSSSDWSTFNGKGTVSSVGLLLGTSGTDLGISGSPVTGSGSITLNVPTASASNRGALSSSDWTTFNNKQAAFTETTERFTGSTTMSVTVAHSPLSSKAQMVFYNGVLIDPNNVSPSGSTYTLSGFTRESADVIEVTYSF